MIKFPFPSEQSNDGGQFAKEVSAKNILTGLVRATDPRHKYKNLQEDKTNRAATFNYQRDEIDDSANYWKSLGKVPPIYPNGPYANLNARIDAVTGNETAENLLNYARMQNQNPDPAYSRYDNPLGQLKATVDSYANAMQNLAASRVNANVDLAAMNYANYLNSLNRSQNFSENTSSASSSTYAGYDSNIIDNILSSGGTPREILQELVANGIKRDDAARIYINYLRALNNIEDTSLNTAGYRGRRR